MKQMPSSTYTLVYNKLTFNNNNHALVIFQAHVFSSGNGVCAAFLANYHAQSAARVMFNNRNYDLPPWSISILPDCRTDAFNTAKVRIFCGACYAMLWLNDGNSCCQSVFICYQSCTLHQVIDWTFLSSWRWEFIIQRYWCCLSVPSYSHGRPTTKIYLLWPKVQGWQLLDS